MTNHIQAIHTRVNGRARYKVNALYHSPSLKKYLERQLSDRAEIRQISANPLTGNLLVLFNPDKRHNQIAELIEDVVLDYEKNQKYESKKPQAKSETKPAVEPSEDQPTKDWHLMDIEAVLEAWNTSKDSGLSPDQAESNLNNYGTNTLAESESRSDWEILSEQFNSLPVALLGVAAGISLLTGGFADMLAIVGVVGVNAAIGYTTESQSEKIIRSLKGDRELSALVMREGTQQEINADDIVPGDILVLQASNYVAADARLIEADNLQIDESALTGESLPVHKTTKPLEGQDVPLAERENMAYKGTFITAGKGLAVVVATGKFTEIGKIQQMVGETTATETPLQKQLDEVGSQLVMLGGGICTLVFGLGLLRGYGLLPMLKTSISLAVASVPEGLPTIATTTLALGIQDMREHNILIRGLDAVEALGSVQTVCLDKTGTITQNKMIVTEVHTAMGVITRSEDHFVTEDDQPINPQDYPELLKLIQVSVLCSESEVNRSENGDYEVNGSATENALIYMAIQFEIDAIALRQEYPLVTMNPRSEGRNLMSTVHKTDESHKFVAVKGSPAEVLELCNSWMKNGKILPLNDEDKQALELENEKMAGKALRVLGVAYTTIENSDKDAETDLIWLGLTGMADPIREGIPQLMEGFHKAGMNTIMITGDQSPTAYAIAKTLNLSRDQQLEILDSSDLAHFDPEKMQALFDKVDVFARISPADKLQIVQALQASGQVVAMTGDGINDTPALKAANVGVAMGSGGGEVVHEVADVVVEDDNLQTLINAVSQGRTIYNNIRKSVHFLLSTNLSEIMVTTMATAMGLGEPLTAMQLLWLNLVSDIFPGLALALEPPEPNVLESSPRDPEEPIIKESDFARIASESAAISLSAMTAYSYGLLRYGMGQKASTIIFMSLTMAQILHTLSCRSESQSIFDVDQDPLPHNPYMDGAIIGSFAIQLLPTMVPGLRTLLNLAPVDVLDCLVIGSSAFVPFVVNESTKKQNFDLKMSQQET
ncbi:HAD-IC family P-type ATPase [Coleofasciculus sp. E1-EBD-02]|uniref:HAD-IC family P-type ATPase n=1 Tax=Coleofasciculus sp. E1-EBD-02 TaxID=3068481 RepID=UPI0032FCF238